MKTLRVRREVAAGVVADQQDRALLGDVAQPADLAAEVEARQQPQAAAASRGCSRGRARRGRRPGCGCWTAPASARSAAAAPAQAGRRPRRSGAGVVARRHAVAVGRVAVAATLVRRVVRLGSSDADVYAAARARARAAPSASARAKKRRSSPLVCSGRSTCGTWPQPSSTICSARGQPLGDVALEAGAGSAGRASPRRTARARSSVGQARVEAAAAERLVEVDVARRAQEGEARAGASRRCAGTRRRRRRRRPGRSRRGRRTGDQNWRGDACRGAKRWGSRPSSGRSEADDRVVAALDEGDGGTQQRRAPPTRSGCAQADLERHAAAHRVADEVRALDAQRVHHADARSRRTSAAL